MDVRILGPLEVVRAEGPVELPRGRASALLALLTIHAGTVLSTDRLIDELWGPSPPSTARTKLHGLVSSLRSRLEPDRSPGEDPHLLLTQAPGYVLAIPPGRVDAQRFRWLVDESEGAHPARGADILRQALDLWRGPALADFAYEPFAQREISSLEELRVDAIEKRVEADLALHRHRKLIPELESLVADHPFREGLRGQLMLALYRSGRQAEALTAYRKAERTFLEDLGIDPGPSLQRMEHAILQQDPGLDLEPPPSGTQTGVEPAAPTEPYLSEARKTVTMVFTELVSGQTQSDPEMIHREVRGAHQLATELFEEYGGTLQGFIGGVLVTVFGAPFAHEDDALRAARASVRLEEELKTLHDGRPGENRTSLMLRSGIATGEVIIGDLTVRHGGISGEVASLAGVLLQAAEVGQILVGKTTRGLLGDAVLVEPMDPLRNDRWDLPVEAWRLAGVIPGARPRQHPRRDAPMVGRDVEIEWLNHRLRKVDSEGRPRTALVIGEAGIGKSRLAMEFASRLEPHVLVITGHCQAFGERTTLWPIREIVRGVAGGLGYEHIESALPSTEHGGFVAKHLTGLLSGDGSLGEAHALFPVMRDFFAGLASQRLVVVVLEDLHWAQQTLLDLVDYLAASIDGRVLFLCLARPEFAEVRPGWIEGEEAVERLFIEPLDDGSVEELVGRLPAGRPMSAENRQRIARTAQGNPLFVQQMLAALRDDPDTSIPANVRALLNARLDRLGPAERDVMRLASVLGSSFTLRTLSALLPKKARPSLERHLQGLAEKKLLVPDGDTDGSARIYEFGHVMIQMAAYRSITMETRAHLHGRVADSIEAGGWVGESDVDEIVGFHLEKAVECRRALGEVESDETDMAIRAGKRLAAAGLRAFDRFDAAGAEDLLTRATELFPPDYPESWEIEHKLAETHQTMGRHEDALAVLTAMLGRPEEDARRELTLRIERERTRLAIGIDDVDLDELACLANRARNEFRKAGDRSGIAQAMFTLAEIEQQSGNAPEMERLAGQALDHADKSGNTRYALGSRRLVATALLNGPVPVPECIRMCEELAWRGRRSAAVLPVLGQLHAMVGEFEVAREMMSEARSILLETARARRPLGLVGRRAAEIEILAGDFDAAERELRKALDLNLEIHVREEASRIASMLYTVLADRGRHDEAEPLVTISLDHAPEWNVIAKTMSISTEARLMASRGEYDKAESLARKAVDGTPDELPGIRADRLVDLGAVLLDAGRAESGATALGQAARLYEQKGNTAAHEWVQAGRSIGQKPSQQPSNS